MQLEDFLKTIDPKLLDKLAAAPGFDRAIKEMAQQWTKFHGGKFVLEYATGLIKKGKVIRFEVETLFDKAEASLRRYDIQFVDEIEGVTKTIKLELRNWTGFWGDSIKKQFTKDQKICRPQNHRVV